MKTVLLVDDEPSITEGLLMMVDWDKYGYEVCGLCEDGYEALKYIENNKPDVVITDIRMPVMNGLQLIKAVKQSANNGTEFIILSGYGEFDYAKTAIEYGVNNYLLKPIMPDDLHTALQFLNDKLKHKDKQRVIADLSDNEIISSEIESITMDRYDKKENRLRKYKNIIEQYNEWCYVLIEFGCGREFDESDLFKEKVTVTEALEMLYADDERIFFVEQSINTIGIALAEKSDDKNSLFDDINTIYDCITRIKGINCFIFVGKTVNCIMDLRSSYTTANEAMSFKFFKKVNSIIYYDEIKNQALNTQFEDMRLLSNIIESMENLDIKSLENSIEVAFSHYKAKLLNPQLIKCFIVNVVYTGINNIRKKDGEPNAILAKHCFQSIDDKNLTMDDLKIMLKKFCEDYTKYMWELKDNSYSSNVQVALQYIKENFTTGITIKEIAQKLYIHPVYLGQIFNKSFGMSVNEYMNNLRIEQAKRLIDETDVMICEIAEMVGYNSYNNFYNNFYKLVGITPNEYKKQVHK